MVNRIQTPCLKPLGRVEFQSNPNCKCSTCVQIVKPNIPWMQSIPRFSVVDNHQRSIPELKPIRSAKPSPSATMTSSKSDEMMQAQIKLNAELMQRVSALEAEKKILADEVKKLQAECDRSKKLNAFYRTKFADSITLKEKLDNRTPDVKVDSSANKENLMLVQSENTSN